MLEVVRTACERGSLVTRADANPYAERDRAHGWHRLCNDPKTARQDGAADHRAVGAGDQHFGTTGLLFGPQMRTHSFVLTDPEALAAAGSPSTTGTSDNLPRGSISLISTCTLSPTLTTSSTFSTRLPPEILRSSEICSKPSLPGTREMNAPNAVVFTTVPR